MTPITDVFVPRLSSRWVFHRHSHPLKMCHFRFFGPFQNSTGLWRTSRANLSVFIWNNFILQQQGRFVCVRVCVRLCNRETFLLQTYCSDVAQVRKQKVLGADHLTPNRKNDGETSALSHLLATSRNKSPAGRDLFSGAKVNLSKV